MELQEVRGGRGMGWIDLVQDKNRWWAIVNVVMGAIKCGEFVD